MISSLSDDFHRHHVASLMKNIMKLFLVTILGFVYEKFCSSVLLADNDDTEDTEGIVNEVVSVQEEEDNEVSEELNQGKRNSITSFFSFK